MAKQIDEKTCGRKPTIEPKFACDGCPGLNTKERKAMKKPEERPRRPDSTATATEPPTVSAATEPPITDHEIHVVNLIEVFKAKQAEEMTTFCDELSRLQNPYDKLRFAYEVCK